MIRPFTWRRRLLFLLAGMVAVVSLLILYSAHPLAYVLRVRLGSLLAGEPEISLDFVRDPSDQPVLGSGTAVTPMIVMDACVLSDADGLHLFFSTFFCRTETGLSPFWTAETGPQFDPRTLTTGIAYRETGLRAPPLGNSANAVWAGGSAASGRGNRRYKP